MPVKRNSEAGSARLPPKMQSRAVWAIASMMRTPGMMGRPGKWPMKKGSFIETFLIPTILVYLSISTILSTRRNGYL